jgi:hypothetical protein
VKEVKMKSEETLMKRNKNIMKNEKWYDNNFWPTDFDEN